MSSKEIRLFSYTFIGLILPVLLIYFDGIPFKYRSFVLFFVIAITFLGIYTEKMSKVDLGIRIDNLKIAFLPYFLFTLITAVLVAWYAGYAGKPGIENWWNVPYLQFVFIPTSVSQEFIYRGFFQTQYQRVFKPAVSIILSAIIFSFMHILWNSTEFLIMTLIGGLFWGILWQKYPNLLLISVSHAILNFIINYFGFITIGSR